MPPHQDVELVTGSYGTRCDAELARGVLDFDPWPAYVSVSYTHLTLPTILLV